MIVKMFGVLLLIVMLPVLWYFVGAERTSDQWGYRMTVVVETPEGIKTGSAVRKIYVKNKVTPYTKGKNYLKLQVEGEAVAVDLGERGVLFAVMDDNGSRGVLQEFGLMPLDFLAMGAENFYKKYESRRFTLDREMFRFPQLVTFTDLNDPKTVQNVLVRKLRKKPGYPKYIIEKDNTEKYFGKDVRIKEVYVQLTNAPVTWGIEKYIPWLPGRKTKRGNLDGAVNDPGASPSKTHLGGIHFSRGKFWLLVKGVKNNE